jgi:hypothetical protein
MKKFLTLLLFLPIMGMAQHTQFQFTKDTITDYVVTSVEGKTAAELYKKTLDWINVTYKNPREVIKSQIENEYIRIEGSSETLVVLKPLYKVNYLSRYSVEFYFKEGRFKMDVIRVEGYSRGTDTSAPRWFDMDISSPKECYKDNGDLRSNYKFWPDSFCSYFNGLLNELVLFMKNDKVNQKSEKW